MAAEVIIIKTTYRVYNSSKFEILVFAVVVAVAVVAVAVVLVLAAAITAYCS